MNLHELAIRKGPWTVNSLKLVCNLRDVKALKKQIKHTTRNGKQQHGRATAISPGSQSTPRNQWKFRRNVGCQVSCQALGRGGLVSTFLQSIHINPVWWQLVRVALAVCCNNEWFYCTHLIVIEILSPLREITPPSQSAAERHPSN